MSTPAATPLALAQRRSVQRAVSFTAYVLGTTLLTATAWGATPAPPPTPTAQTLLSGATPAKSKFHVTTNFRMTQNTIQLDAHLGSGSGLQTFILDSGAPMTISPEIVHELGLKPVASVALAGPEGGHLKVPVADLPEITVAGLGFLEVGAVVDWVEPPDTLACLSTAGLMGASLLQTAIWQIDFQRQQITASSSLKDLEGLENAISIPFKRSDSAGSPRISVGVSGIDDVSLLIDLGFNGSIAIPSSVLQKAGDQIPATAPTEVGQAASTVFGQAASENRIAHISELRIGDLRLTNFPVITGSAVSDFHVGIDFLRHFRVTLDWLNNTLYLEPREPVTALYPSFPTYGFAPKLHNGQLIVSALWRGGAADEVGLELGDRLVAINGQDTATPDFKTLCGLLNEVSLYGSNSAPIAVTRLRSGVRETFDLSRKPLITDQAVAIKQ